MGKKAKRWRSRAQQLRLQVVRVEPLKELLDRTGQELKAAQRELAAARRRLQNVEDLACFRVAVRDLPFGRVGGPVYAAQVTFDPRMIEYGLYRVTKPFDPYDVSRYVHLLSQELAANVERELHKQLAELNGYVRR